MNRMKYKLGLHIRSFGGTHLYQTLKTLFYTWIHAEICVQCKILNRNFKKQHRNLESSQFKPNSATTAHVVCVCVWISAWYFSNFTEVCN